MHLIIQLINKVWWVASLASDNIVLSLKVDLSMFLFLLGVMGLLLVPTGWWHLPQAWYYQASCDGVLCMVMVQEPRTGSISRYRNNFLYLVESWEFLQIIWWCTMLDFLFGNWLVGFLDAHVPGVLYCETELWQYLGGSWAGLACNCRLLGQIHSQKLVSIVCRLASVWWRARCTCVPASVFEQ